MHSGWWWIPSAIDVRSVSGFISIPILHGQALRWPGSLPTVPPVNWIPIFWSLGPRKRFGAWVIGSTRYHLESYFFSTGLIQATRMISSHLLFQGVTDWFLFLLKKKLSRPCVWWRIRIVAWQEINGEIVKHCLTAILLVKRKKASGWTQLETPQKQWRSHPSCHWRIEIYAERYELKLKRHVSAVSIALRAETLVKWNHTVIS